MKATQIHVSSICCLLNWHMYEVTFSNVAANKSFVLLLLFFFFFVFLLLLLLLLLLLFLFSVNKKYSCFNLMPCQHLGGNSINLFCLSFRPFVQSP